MLGASNYMTENATSNWLSFRVKGSPSINYIKVTLNGLDLYDMEFGKIGRTSYKVVATESNVYADQLKPFIEKHTKLYTSL